MLSATQTNRLLITRLSAIGDIVMASPVASAIKRHNPNTHITWLTQPECASLVAAFCDVDEVIIWPRKEWEALLKQRQFLTLSRAIRQFRKDLARHQFDTAIDLQGLLKSGVLTWLAGAKQSIGLGSREGSHRLMDTVIDRMLGNQDLIGSEYRSMIEHLTGKADYQLEFHSGESQKLVALGQFRDWDIDRKRPLLVLCPFTTRPQKHWIDNHWQSLFDQLLADGNFELAIMGGPADAEHAKQLIEDRDIHNLAGKTSLPEAVTIILEAAGLVGVDTGLTHIGHAANIPTVAIFGSTRPYLDTEKIASDIIYQPRSCSPCKRSPTCDGRYDCMRDISPDLVYSRLQNALQAAANSDGDRNK